MVAPWEGGYTLVAIDTKGRIRGVCSRTNGRVYKDYGENLFPYALKKAAYRLYLGTNDYNDGLNSDRNIRVLRAVLPQSEHIYLGEAVTDIFDGSQIIIGASGCELNRSYKEGLAPKMIRRDNVNFVAGYADMVFAEGMANRIDNYLISDIPVNQPLRSFTTTVNEPVFFSTLRRSH